MLSMASITEFKDGRWRAQTYRNGIRKSKVCETRAIAEAWAAAVEGMAEKRDITTFSMQERLDLKLTALITGVPRRVLEANAAIPYSHSQILDAAIPITMPCGVYFLIKGDEVIYVGQSVVMLHRIARHWREGREFDGYACIQCKPEEMDRLEALYIAAFAPYLNTTFGNVAAGKLRTVSEASA